MLVPPRPQATDLNEMVYLRAAFGQPNNLTNGLNPPGSPNPRMPAGFLTVFDPRDFGKVWAQIERLQQAAAPVVVRETVRVVENKHWGVAGGWSVDVVFVILTPVRAWRAALPPQSAALLPSYFPNYEASEVTSQLQISAISQMASWLTAHHALPQIRAMLAA